LSLENYTPLDQPSRLLRIVGLVVTTCCLGVALFIGQHIFRTYLKEREQDALNEMRQRERDALLDAQLHKFDGQAGQYIIPGSALNEPESAKPYIQGKILVIDRREKQVDPFYRYIPDDLRATNPSEVGTVIWLDRGKKLEGYYTNGAWGYSRSVRMTIIDWTNKALVDSRIIVGEDPPDRTTKRDFEIGGVPYDTMLRNLDSIKNGRVEF
jgi:hypothetical protein